MTYRLLKFIKASYFNRFLVGFTGVFIALTVAGLIFLYPLRAIYYGVFDGDYFLNVRSAVAELKVEQDDDLSVAFCRYPRARITAVNNVRTFYLAENGFAVYERRLPDNITYERTRTACQPLTIKPDQRPNEVGKYQFCQEFDFFVEFNNKKTSRFCSTEFEVVVPVLGSPERSNPGE